MKELMRIMWVLLIQYIACSLAGWATSVMFSILALLIMWQGIFAYINYRVRKQKCLYSQKDVSPVMYMVLSVPAICFPVLALFIFFGLSIYRVCVISGVTVGDESLKDQFYFDRAFQSDPFPYESGLHDSAGAGLNPATGLPMCGLVDTSGNFYGCSSESYRRSDS